MDLVEALRQIQKIVKEALDAEEHRKIRHFGAAACATTMDDPESLRLHVGPFAILGDRISCYHCGTVGERCPILMKDFGFCGSALPCKEHDHLKRRLK
jgi:hypothetical protein